MRILKLLAIASVLFAACKNNNYIVDQDVRVPSYARFMKSDTPRMVVAKLTPTQIYIPFSITGVSSTNKDVMFTSSSRSAVYGAQYTFPQTHTVAAGNLVDSIPFSGDYNAFTDPSNSDTVKITISNQGSIPGCAMNNTYNVILSRACTSSDTADFHYINGSYPKVSEVKNVTSIDPISYTSPVTISNYTRFGLDSASFTLTNFLNKGIVLTVKMKVSNRYLKVVPRTYDDVAEGYTYEIRSTNFTRTFDVCAGTANLPVQVRKYPIGTTPSPTWPSSKEYEILISKH